jgi:hypothetical protein
MDSRTSFPGRGDEWRERIGRAGFAAKGMLFAIIGIIAAAVAFGGEDRAADQTGALRSLGDDAVGTALLVALAVGLGAYALFRLVEAVQGPASKAGTEAKLERVASVVRFVIYGVLCVSAVRLLTESGGAGTDERETTSTVFDLPAGVAIVFTAGLVLVGVGLYQGYRSLTTSFEEELEVARMSPRMRTVARLLGIGGHAARAVIFPLVGLFLIRAAVEHDSREAKGIDGALNELARQPLGEVLLFAVAAGLIVYGAYCLIEARYRRL